MKSLDARQEPRLEDRSTDELESITEPDDNAAISCKTPRAMALEAMCTLLELLHLDITFPDIALALRPDLLKRRLETLHLLPQFFGAGFGLFDRGLQ